MRREVYALRPGLRQETGTVGPSSVLAHSLITQQGACESLGFKKNFKLNSPMAGLIVKCLKLVIEAITQSLIFNLQPRPCQIHKISRKTLTLWHNSAYQNSLFPHINMLGSIFIYSLSSKNQHRKTSQSEAEKGRRRRDWWMRFLTHPISFHGLLLSLSLAIWVQELLYLIITVWEKWWWLHWCFFLSLEHMSHLKPTHEGIQAEWSWVKLGRLAKGSLLFRSLTEIILTF